MSHRTLAASRCIVVLLAVLAAALEAWPQERPAGASSPTRRKAPPGAAAARPEKRPAAAPSTTRAAKPAPPATAAQPAEEPGAIPPAALAAAGVSLAEAVQTTLQNDPQLGLRRADVDFAAGVAQQQGGLFDLSLAGSALAEYRQQELRESRKEIEQQKRDDLDEIIGTGEAFEKQARQLVGEIDTALASAPGHETISDPVVQSQVVLVTAMLNQVEDQTARDELLKLRRRILEDNLTSVSSKLQDALADLDEARDKRQRMGATPFDEVFKRSTFGLNVSKRFRSGIYVSPFVDGRLDGTNFKGKEIDADLGGKDIQDLYTFRSGLDLTLPLLRGRGATAVAAGERAARAEHQAAQASFKHQESLSVLRTAQAYWDLRAAQDALDVARRSQGLQDRLLDATRRLIDGGELPEADIARAQASHTRARARMEDAQRRLIDARVSLALAMGVAVADDPARLPLARDGFPAPQPESLPGEAEIQALVAAAGAQRQDLKASVSRTESGAFLVRGARADMRPRLDLSGRTWVSGLGEIDASNALDRWVGPSFSVSLGLELPLGNNFYRGRAEQRQADLRRREIASAELGRQIRLSVVRTSVALREAAARVEHAEQAVGFSKRSIDSELEKFQAGDATLIDTILTEDQQTDALMTLVAARQEYAQLVAQLRYESGLLAQAGSGPHNLVTVPRGVNP